MPDAREYIKKTHPLFSENYEKVVAGNIRNDETVAKFKKLGIEKSSAVLKFEFDKLFKIEKVSIKIPSYAPSHENIICDKCGELVMSSRIVRKKKKIFV